LGIRRVSLLPESSFDITKLKVIEHLLTVSFVVDSILHHFRVRQVMIRVLILPVCEGLLQNLSPQMALTRCGK